MRSLRHDTHNPVLITEAPVSVDQEFSSRRRRYLIMMFGRAFCVIAAVLVYHVSGWLAALFLIGAAVLPWAAVLLANARPAKSAVQFRRFFPGQGAQPRQLTGRDRQQDSATAPPAPDTDSEVIDL